MTRPVLILNDLDLRYAALAMANAEVEHVLVLVSELMVGEPGLNDVLVAKWKECSRKQLDKMVSDIGSGWKGDIMDIRGIIKTKDIEMIDGTSTVADAIARMMDRNIGSVIVKRTVRNEPYGIITRRDVLFRVIAEGLDPREVKVTDIMSSPVVILNNVDLDVRYAAKAMANAGVSNLVIFDGGDFYGFLSSTDIIDAIRKDLTIKALASNTEDISGGC